MRMKSTCNAIIMGALIAVLLPALAVAEEHPIQLALFNPLQIFPEEDHVSVFRFNLIYGRNASITGIDLGLVNHTTSGLSRGIQWGFVSWNDAEFTGWQYSAANVTKGQFKGLQLGVVNYAAAVRGLQVGIFNYTETAYGLQIGFVNVIKDGGDVLPVMPLVNWSF